VFTILGEAALIRVIVVDDHPPFRVGIKGTLAKASDIQVVGEANNGREMFSILGRNQATDVVLLDIEMPDFKIYDAVAQIQAEYPQLKILIVSGYDDRGRILRLIQLGVRGYMLKDEPLNMYAYAIREVAGGRTYFSSQVAHVALTENGRDAIVLTPREHEVLSLVALGEPSPAIGLKLGISPKTVDTHVERACRKLGANNRTTAVLRARELELITVPAREENHNGA
jgi:DNA-binding NarL/FixJ family response regulator